MDSCESSAPLLELAPSRRRLAIPRLVLLWSLAPAWVGAQEEPPCTSSVAVGFSTATIASAVPFDGVVGAAGEEEVTVEFRAEDLGGSALVYVNLISQLGFFDGAVAGWSLSIAFDGDLKLLSIRRVLPPPRSTEPSYPRIVDPARNQGQLGIIEQVQLEEPLPQMGTQSVLGIEVGWSGGPLPAAGRTARIRFLDGLVGSGQPFTNVISVNGGLLSVRCNFDVASVTVRFVEAPARPFIRGNANGDGRVDIADSIWMLNDLFLGGPPTPCRDASDANGDGELGISDPIFLLNSQFLGTRVPPAPFPDCATDPSGGPGPLGCAASPCPTGT
jgi:hypothetical protein